jgi:hypothetical protein
LRLGQANHLVAQLRPFLQTHAHEFERERFEKLLRSNQVTFANTRLVVDQSVQALRQEASLRNVEGVIGEWEGAVIEPGKFQLSHSAVYNHVLLSLIFSPEPLTLESVPELLSMDAKRCWKWQNQVQRLVIVASMCTLGGTFVKGWKQDAHSFAQRCLSLLSGVETNDDGPKITVENLMHDLVEALDAWLTCAGKEPLEESTKETIRNLVKKQLDPNDRMFALLMRRLRDRMRIHLERGTVYVPGSTSPRKKNATGPEAEEQIKRERDASLATVGLDVVGDELESLCKEVSRLAKYNKTTYAQWWDEVISKSISK